MFFVIDETPSGEEVERYRTDFYYDDKVGRRDAEKCPKCGAYISMIRRIPPFTVCLETWGEGFGDLAFWLDAFLVTDRFRTAFERSGLTGLCGFNNVQVKSVRKHQKFKAEIPLYSLTMPNLGSAKIDPVASGIDWGEPNQSRCEVCLTGPGVLKRWKSVVVDESTWNGDDIFYAYGLPGSLIVSSRFASWANEHEFKNLILVDAQSSSHDFYPMETFNQSS